MILWLMEIYSCSRAKNILHWKVENYAQEQEMTTSTTTTMTTTTMRESEGKGHDGFRFSTLRTPHLVNGFLFTLHLIGGIFSSFWVDGLRLTFFPLRSPSFSPSLIQNDDLLSWVPFHIKTSIRWLRVRIHNFFFVPFSLRFSFLGLVINWISSFATGLSVSHHDMITLRNINEISLIAHMSLSTPGLPRESVRAGMASTLMWQRRRAEEKKEKKLRHVTHSSRCKWIVIKCSVNVCSRILKLDTFFILCWWQWNEH